MKSNSKATMELLLDLNPLTCIWRTIHAPQVFIHSFLEWDSQQRWKFVNIFVVVVELLSLHTWLSFCPSNCYLMFFLVICDLLVFIILISPMKLFHLRIWKKLHNGFETSCWMRTFPWLWCDNQFASHSQGHGPNNDTFSN